MKFFSRKNSDSSKTNLTEKSSNDDSPYKGPYPKYVFLIILMDLCERFSFYGFRNVMYVYLSKFISMDSVTATAIYHAFSLVCNFTPIIGKTGVF